MQVGKLYPWGITSYAKVDYRNRTRDIALKILLTKATCMRIPNIQFIRTKVCSQKTE